MTDSKTATERLREMLGELGVEYEANDETGVMETSWLGCTAFQLSPTAKMTMIVTPEQAIAATLGSGTHVYVLRGTDPNVMPSYGGEMNELLAVYATREAAEKAKSEWRRYCDLNITEWEVA